jgi:hypothetical protein
MIITSAAIQCGMPHHVHLASQETALIVITQVWSSCNNNHCQLKHFPVMSMTIKEIYSMYVTGVVLSIALQVTLSGSYNQLCHYMFSGQKKKSL